MRRFTTSQHTRVSAVIALFLSILMTVFNGAVAHAAPTPSSGPATGGTSVTVNGISFTQVVGGGNFSLGLTSEGTVYAWGGNGYGQLGNGVNTPSRVPVPVLAVGGVAGVGPYLSGVTSIAAFTYSAIAVSSAGAVAWGRNADGQLGDGSTTNRWVPVRVLAVGGVAGVGPYLSGVTSVAVGAQHSLAVASSGVVAWGYNGNGQLGDGTITQSLVPVQVLAVGGSAGSGPYLSGVTSVAASAAYSLAVTSTGVMAWGNNGNGQLGDGTTTQRLVPVQVLAVGGVAGSGPYLSDVTTIAAGAYHSLAATSTGVVAWGYNGTGNLGDGTTTQRLVPVQVLAVGGVAGSGPYLSNVTSVVASVDFSLATTESGLLAWGFNGNGNLGDGTTTQRLVPVQVLAIGGVAGSGPYMSGVTSVAAGSNFALAVTSDDVAAWGFNGAGQMGDGTTTMRQVPVLGPNFQPASVAFGTSVGTALRASGSTWTIVSPAHASGDVTLMGTANVFGGSTAASPATVSWNAGTFTYEAALANTGSPDLLPLGLASTGTVVLGVALLLALRRQKK